MTARLLRPAIMFATVSAVLIAVLAVNFATSAGTTHADSIYKPATSARFCNGMAAFSVDATLVGSAGCPDVLTTGAAADFYTELDMNILGAGQLNFSTVITFAPGATDIKAGGTIPTGSVIGGLRSDTTLGLINGPCNSLLTVEFVLRNIALPNNAADPRASTNIAWPRIEGTSDRFKGWQVSDGMYDVAPTWATNDGNPVTDITVGVAPVPGVTTGTSVAIQNYPVWLLDMFDPDFTPGSTSGLNGSGDASNTPGNRPLVPEAVYGGLTNVAGSWIPLYFAQFESGVVQVLDGALSTADPEMGDPSISILNDPTAVKATPSSISDFCTPLKIYTLLLGTAQGGGVRATNPGTTGTHYVGQYNASVRDLDQDGYENSIDTCPNIVNTGDPRVALSGDTDGDGIADVCDPTPAAATNGDDHDLDGFSNRLDTCPLVSDLSEDGELGAASADLGGRGDSIGNACDSEKGTVVVVQNRSSGTATVSITMSDTVANGRYHVITNIIAKCFGGTTDADGDGYCGTAENADGPAGACSLTTPVSCAVRHTPWGATHPGKQTDVDADGFSDAQETVFGTDATKSCAYTPITPSISGGANDETVDNYPLDFGDNRLVELGDVLKLSPVFGKAINDPLFPQPGGLIGARMDFNMNGLIDLPDVLTFSTPFGKRCGQGTAGMPGPFVQQ